MASTTGRPGGRAELIGVGQVIGLRGYVGVRGREVLTKPAFRVARVVAALPG